MKNSDYDSSDSVCGTNEPRRKKICFLGFRPGPTQTWLYGYKKLLDPQNFGLGSYYLHVCSENKGADQLVCAFFSAYAKTGFLMTRLILHKLSRVRARTFFIRTSEVHLLEQGEELRAEDYPMLRHHVNRQRYSQTCVWRPYKTIYISGFSDRWLFIAV